ncbi:TetR family transcriptional regulator [Rhodococcus sp. 06-235-1A]|uniref:TetR family transcriptional regulator n=1 Tax=Rhodococcus sp. 06-235-1A TaxID=2022508 RepID=UPI000B9BF5EB|nr:TetR family transcriptional regulator [Rhodococcus sp. 06-235-1A]OZD08188.1 TetR family transcriptional regulator [Rhodococcus sp. 06-235-1A]
MRGEPDESTDFRLTVATAALDLFSVKGYESTTVDDIAGASGISRRTFFRQFRAKEDVVFADHEILLEQAGAFLDSNEGDPWQAVCDAAQQVYERFSDWLEMSRLRYQVVHRNPALRDREIVTVFRYDRLFVEYLQRALPDHPHLEILQFSASVTATHNYILRRMIRDGLPTSVGDLRSALAQVRAQFLGEIVVASFPRGMSVTKVIDALADHTTD